MIDFDFVPETIDWCVAHYVPPVQKHISCECFGQIDVVNGSCDWCNAMTPYQWHMCADQNWVNYLLSEHSRAGCKNFREAAEFIEKYKQDSILRRFGIEIKG